MGSPLVLERDERSRYVGLFAVVLAFLLPVAYLDGAYHHFLAPKAALALVALVPGVTALVRMARRASGEQARAARLAIGFCVVAAASTLLADVRLLSLTGSAGEGTGLIFVVVCASCWAMGAELTDRHRSLLASAVIAAATVNAAVAWLQARGWVPPGLEMATSGPQAGRAAGLLGNPVHLGALCAGGLVLVGVRVRGDRRFPAWLLAAALLAGAAQLSGARAALALTVLVVAVVLTRCWPGWRRAVLLVAAVSAGLAFASAGAHVTDARSRLQGDASDGTQARVRTWHTAVEAIGDKPFLGWGPGRFAAATTPRYTAEHSKDGVFTNAHNWVLEYATTTGLIGLVLLGGWLWFAARRARGPLAWFALSIGLFALFEPTSFGVTPLALLALGAAGGASETGGGAGRRAGRAVFAAAVAISVVVAGGYVSGELRMRDAYLDSSTSDWKDANALLPSWPEVTYLGARIEAFHALTSAGDAHAKRSLALARQTTARDPADPEWWAYLGYLEMKWGSPDRAADAFAHALDRQPWFAEALQGSAELAGERGDTAGREQACDRLAQVVDRLPKLCRQGGAR